MATKKCQIFENLLLCNWKAYSFDIYCVASHSGPLPILFKSCPWDQNWPSPRVTSLNIGTKKENFKILLL